MRFETFEVVKESCANVVGSGDLEVLATPILIAFMENVANEALKEMLKTGETSVGVKVDMKHLAPSFVGEHITVQIDELTQQENKATFTISAVNEARKLVGSATHTRVIVQKDKFLGGKSK